MKQDLYIGVDVGGTKILAEVVTEKGKILARARTSTPRKARPQQTVKTIIQVIEDALKENLIHTKAVKAIGIGIPGVVHPRTGVIKVTPNMNLSGINIVSPLKKRFNIPVAIGNDVDLGILGEQWLGAARNYDNAIGIFIGTGIGGGIILDGKLVRGEHGAAGEIGHMIIQPDGLDCGCGNKGCLETIAGRSGIERAIRRAVEHGKKTVVTKILDDDLKVIKSKVLRKALQKKDKLVTSIMKKAFETFGYACISIKHMYDPQVIVLGGGLMEACGDFILPMVTKVFASDKFLKNKAPCKIVVSQLEDDAVALGAVALAKSCC